MKIGQCENAARSVTEACLGNHGHCIAGSVTIDVASKLLTTVPALATGTSRTTSLHRPTRTSAA